MAQVSIRNLPDDVVARLKLRAEARGRSLEAELRDILDVASRLSPEEFWARADAIRAATAARGHTDSVGLLREDRDR